MRESVSINWSDDIQTERQTYTATGLTPGKEYMIRVAARDASGYGEFDTKVIVLPEGMDNYVYQIFIPLHNKNKLF